MNEGEELVRQPFERLIKRGALLAHKCNGFWQCMDTFKDKQHLEELNKEKRPPWKVWCDPAVSPPLAHVA
jgi:glucose-1-phosphate cytidylyltransferase